MIRQYFLLIFFIALPLFAGYSGKSSSREVEVITRGDTNEEIENKCTFIYEIPEGFHYDSSLVKQYKAVFSLLQNGKTLRNSIILFGEFTEHSDTITSFAEYNQRELAYLIKHGLYPKVTTLKLKSQKEIPYKFTCEKWIAAPYMYKKLIRFWLPDGFYSISINADSEKKLDDISFDKLWESLHFECPEDAK